MQDLIRKYRPAGFVDVIGQEKVVASLKQVVKTGTSRSFIFTGPSGTGKTTLARIVAARLKCDPVNVMEIDAATHTGIEAMRQVVESMTFRGMSGSSNRAAIIDEAHALSKPAWQSLLKAIEEPPAHAYWMLCTTEPGKIPETILTRCVRYDLRPVGADEIIGLLRKVVAEEKFSTPDEIVRLVGRKAQGSPRRALSSLAAVAACTSVEEAAELLREVVEGDERVIELCRGLVGGITWAKAAAILRDLKEKNPESVRIEISAYLTSVVLGAKSNEQAEKGARLLDAFGTPYSQQSGFQSLVLSCAQAIL